MSELFILGTSFAIASSPATYKLTRKVAGSWVSNFEGVATPAGLFLHTLFFLFVLYIVGRFMPRLSMASALEQQLVQQAGGNMDMNKVIENEYMKKVKQNESMKKVKQNNMTNIFRRYF
jgi:uncharacterized membrane protein YhiD involved in acid resistance